jgi:AcrR family transcriptional regulator
MSTSAAAEAGRRNAQGQRTRDEILDAASLVMSQHGYEGASISAIMKAAGLQKSSIYWQFDSKTAIAAAVMERGAQRFFAALPGGPWKGRTPRERLGMALGETATVLEEHEQFLRLFLMLLITNQDPEVAKILERVRRAALERTHLLLRSAFEPEGAEAAALVADRLHPFGLAIFDGTFLAAQIDADLDLRHGMEAMAEALAHYGAAILAGRRGARSRVRT